MLDISQVNKNRFNNKYATYSIAVDQATRSAYVRPISATYSIRLDLRKSQILHKYISK